MSHHGAVVTLEEFFGEIETVLDDPVPPDDYHVVHVDGGQFIVKSR